MDVGDRVLTIFHAVRRARQRPKPGAVRSPLRCSLAPGRMFNPFRKLAGDFPPDPERMPWVLRQPWMNRKTLAAFPLPYESGFGQGTSLSTVATKLPHTALSFGLGLRVHRLQDARPSATPSEGPRPAPRALVRTMDHPPARLRREIATASPNFELPEAGNLVQCGDIAVVRGCTLLGTGQGRTPRRRKASAWSGVGRVRTSAATAPCAAG